VPRCRSPNPSLPQQQDTIAYAVKISVSRSWRWAKDCPKHVDLILEITKLLLLHLVGSSILLYLLIGFLILACMYVIVVSW